MRVAVVKWAESDDISHSIQSEFERLGVQTENFLFTQTVPKNVDMVMTFAPWGRFLPIAAQLGHFSRSNRPVFIHWSVEAPPNSSIPWPLMKFIGDIRLGVDLLNDSRYILFKQMSCKFPLLWINNHFHRFRHLAEYCYAYQKGWLDLLFDTSAISVKFWRSHGLPAQYIPWGIPRSWHEELNLERDIGVLWMGLRRNHHRSQVIDSVKREMAKRGISMYIADGIERPFIFGEERTNILNRSFITLNIQTERKKNILPMRFVVAAANRSLVLSETTLPHAPELVEGDHYVSAPANLLVDRILYYLEHHQERQSIIERAYTLATIKLTMENSLKMILDKVEYYRSGKQISDD
jgi:hypothetical protein